MPKTMRVESSPSASLSLTVRLRTRHGAVADCRTTEGVAVEEEMHRPERATKPEVCADSPCAAESHREGGG